MVEFLANVSGTCFVIMVLCVAGGSWCDHVKVPDTFFRNIFVYTAFVALVTLPLAILG